MGSSGYYVLLQPLTQHLGKESAVSAPEVSIEVFRTEESEKKNGKVICFMGIPQHKIQLQNC